MRILSAYMCLSIFSLGAAVPCFAERVTNVTDIIQLDKPQESKYQLSAPKGTLPIELERVFKGAPTLTPQDNTNLTELWQTILAKNPVIQYGLKQLATPPELRYAHASIMSRTLSGLLSGAALLPYMMGGDQFTAGATSVGTQMVDRALNQSKKVDPALLPSDSELVELSGMVQELQQNLVDQYLQYKQALTSAVGIEQQLVKINQLPSTQDEADKLAQTQLKQSLLLDKLASEQEAQLAYLTLERLAGIEGMRRLQFDGLTQESALPEETSSPSLSQNPTETTLK